jgi:hypothetical protein
MVVGAIAAKGVDLLNILCERDYICEEQKRHLK